MKRTLLSLLAIMALTFTSFSQLWVTQNSGMADSRGITDMKAVDANIVWCAAYDGTAPTNPCVDLTKTSNGGTLWSPKTITGATGVSIANVTAIDENKAWAITYYPSGSGANDGVYYTADGGTTWTHQTTAPFSNSASFPDCIWFWDANVGYCMGDPINGEFEIYTTTNGGTTWTVVPGANIPNPVSGEFGIVGYHSIVGNTVWFGTNKGRIYKSIDKGLNWTVAVCTPLNNKYIMPFFKDQNFGLIMDKDAATTGFLAVTTDGGTTFAARNNIGNTFTNDMSYVPGTASTWVTTGADVTNGYAGVTYSLDDGLNWIDMTETIGMQYLATDWVNTSTAWAGGFVASGAEGMYKFNDNLVGPTPGFTASDTAIELGGTVTFTNTSTGATSYLWTFQNGLPASSTQQNPPPVTYSTPGAHDVTLKATNTWGAVSLVKADFIYVGGVGINEHSAASISVYPNPVKDVLNIESSSTMQEIQIYNVVGQLVYTQKVDNKTLTMNTNLKTGMYNLKVKLADGFVNKKIVVN
jgi:PKD repeat protein